MALANARPDRYGTEARRHSRQALERANQVLTYSGDKQILESMTSEFAESTTVSSTIG